MVVKSQPNQQLAVIPFSLRGKSLLQGINFSIQADDSVFESADALGQIVDCGGYQGQIRFPFLAVGF